jgi:DNA-binding CsgD family transcriptional regulator
MIEAEGLTKRYGDQVAVDALTFTAHDGTVTGFVGPNGAGKSTTMRMIAGLDEPTSGTVRGGRPCVSRRDGADGAAGRPARGQGGAPRPVGTQPSARPGPGQRHRPAPRHRGDRDGRTDRGREQARRWVLARDGPTFDVDQYVFDGIQAGASGFLLKDATPATLVDAIRTVARGDAVLAPSATRRLVNRFATQPAEPERVRRADPSTVDTLTEREREVFLLIARGLSNREIAAELFLSEHTVKIHVARVLAKLNLRDRVQAVVLAYESGLA